MDVTAVTSHAVDLDPFHKYAPTFSFILARAHASSPGILHLKPVMDTLLHLYCINPRRFMEIPKLEPLYLFESHRISHVVHILRRQVADEVHVAGFGHRPYLSAWRALLAAFRRIYRLPRRAAVDVNALLLSNAPGTQDALTLLLAVSDMMAVLETP